MYKNLKISTSDKLNRYIFNMLNELIKLFDKACAEGQLEVVKELLAKGADIEAASNQGNRALSFGK